MLRATQVPMHEFICDLRFRHLKVWREADFLCPRAINKKAVTYHMWCGSSESGPRGFPFSIPSYLYKDLDNMCRGTSAGSDCVHTIWEWRFANDMVVLAFVINVSVEKFKMRSMCFSFASVLKCVSCAWDTETFFKEWLRLCVRLLLRALNLFLSWLVITVLLILKSMHSWTKTHTDSSSLCQI